jgi:hypothetical protein
MVLFIEVKGRAGTGRPIVVVEHHRSSADAIEEAATDE